MNATTANVALTNINDRRYVVVGYDAAGSIVHADTSPGGRQVRYNRFTDDHDTNLSSIAYKSMRTWNCGLRDEGLIRATLPNRGRNREFLQKLRSMLISELLDGSSTVADIFENASNAEKRVSPAVRRRMNKSGRKPFTMSPELEDEGSSNRKPKMSADANSRVDPVSKPDGHTRLEEIEGHEAGEASISPIKRENSTESSVVEVADLNDDSSPQATISHVDRLVADYRALWKTEEEKSFDQLAADYEAKWLALEPRTGFELLCYQYERRWLQQEP